MVSENFIKFKNVIHRLYKHKTLFEQFCENNVYTYKTLILEDDYINDSLLLIDYLINELYPTHRECVYWFMYEWKPGYSITDKGVEYVINRVEDYLDYKEKTWYE